MTKKLTKFTKEILYALQYSAWEYGWNIKVIELPSHYKKSVKMKKFVSDAGITKVKFYD